MENNIQKDSLSSTVTPIRVFIVEDYHLSRLGLISALSEFPQLKFIGDAESAEEALTQLEKLTPDVVILDLGLPGMNGIEMAGIVRSRWPDVKIVILTSHNEEEEVIASLGAGAHAYALKDIKPERLMQVIETVYEGAIWLDPAIASLVLSMVTDPNSITTFRRQAGLPPANGEPVVDLTEREREVLQLIVEGKNNPEIAETLHISIHTAKAHVGNILSKLCVNDRVQAAIKALKENIV